MLIFSKDISERDHVHCREDQNPELKAYMEYQRKLFPYTIVRAGLDLAYKELDDILNYVDNDYQKPEDGFRDTYPEDVTTWYRGRFPWSASFMEMESMHSLLVAMIKAMDSFRTQEMPNTYHWVVLYDSVHNIVGVYNDLLADNPDGARDIRLSDSVPVDFDDFINNYWPHLEFMILSKPDYPHRRLMERNFEIEEIVKGALADGVAPLEALDKANQEFGFATGTLPLLRRGEVEATDALLNSESLKANQFAPLLENTPADHSLPGIPLIDAEYELNFQSQARRAAS